MQLQFQQKAELLCLYKVMKQWNSFEKGTKLGSNLLPAEELQNPFLLNL